MPSEIYDFIKIEAVSENRTMASYIIDAILKKANDEEQHLKTEETTDVQ
jgi:hypothetical protein